MMSTHQTQKNTSTYTTCGCRNCLLGTMMLRTLINSNGVGNNDMPCINTNTAQHEGCSSAGGSNNEQMSLLNNLNSILRTTTELVSPSSPYYPITQQRIPIRVRLAIVSSSHPSTTTTPPTKGFPSHYDASPMDNKLETYFPPLSSPSSSSATNHYLTIADFTQYIVEELFINNKETHFLDRHSSSKFMTILLGNNNDQEGKNIPTDHVVFHYGMKKVNNKSPLEEAKTSSSSASSTTKSTPYSCIIHFALMEEGENNGVPLTISPSVNAHEMLSMLYASVSNAKKLDLILKARVVMVRSPLQQEETKKKKGVLPVKRKKVCNELKLGDEGRQTNNNAKRGKKMGQEAKEEKVLPVAAAAVVVIDKPPSKGKTEQPTKETISAKEPFPAKELIPANSKHANGIPPALSEAWENQKATTAPLLVSTKKADDDGKVKKMEVEEQLLLSDASTIDAQGDDDDESMDVDSGNVKEEKKDDVAEQPSAKNDLEEDSKEKVLASAELLSSSTNGGGKKSEKGEEKETKTAGQSAAVKDKSSTKSREESISSSSSDSSSDEDDEPETSIHSVSRLDRYQRADGTSVIDKDSTYKFVDYYASGGSATTLASSATTRTNASITAGGSASDTVIDTSANQKKEEEENDSSSGESSGDSSSSGSSSGSGSGEDSEDEFPKDPHEKMNDTIDEFTEQMKDDEGDEPPKPLATDLKATPHISADSNDPNCTQESILCPAILFDKMSGSAKTAAKIYHDTTDVVTEQMKDTEGDDEPPIPLATDLKATPHISADSNDPNCTQESILCPAILFEEMSGSAKTGKKSQHKRGSDIEVSNTPAEKKQDEGSSSSSSSSGSSSSSDGDSEESSESEDEEKEEAEGDEAEKASEKKEATTASTLKIEQTFGGKEKSQLYPLTQPTKSDASSSSSSGSSSGSSSSSSSSEEEKKDGDKNGGGEEEKNKVEPTPMETFKTGHDKDDGSSSSSSSSSDGSSSSSSDGSSSDSDSSSGSSDDEEEKEAKKEEIPTPSSKSIMTIVRSSSRGRHRRTPLVSMSRKIVISTTAGGPPKMEKFAR